MMKTDRCIFIINPDKNGGEAVILTTTILKGELSSMEPFLEQELTIHSYCNSTTVTLCGAVLTPTILREMADEIEDLEKRFKKSNKSSSFESLKTAAQRGEKEQKNLKER